jgi:hypothetical protein
MLRAMTKDYHGYMSMARKNTPDMLDISAQQLSDINARISSNSLLEEDKHVIVLVLSAYAWIQTQLQRHKLSIKRLKNMFGFKTEKRKRCDQQNVVGTGLDLSTAGDTPSLPDATKGEVTPVKKHLNGTEQKIMGN